MFRCGRPGEGCTRGVEVKDGSEDVFLPHLTTKIPVKGGEDRGKQSTLNWKELEECDECPDQGSSFMWFSSGRTPRHSASVAGHAHLMDIPPQEKGLASLVTRHNVDAFVWQPENSSLEHTATFAFSALGYVHCAGHQAAENVPGYPSRQFLHGHSGRVLAHVPARCTGSPGPGHAGS